MNFINKCYQVKWRPTLYVIYCLFLLILNSCLLKDDADFDFPQSPNRLMVEAYLCPGENYQLVLMESNSLAEELFLHLNWRAKVYIYKGDEKICLYNMINRNENTLYMYNYGTPQNIPLSYDGDFKLEIETNEGNYIIGSTSVVAPVHINKVKVQENLIDVSFLNDVNKSQRYYLLLAEGICDKEDVSERQYLDFREMNSGMVIGQLKGNFSSWESLTVKLFHITKENFEFQESLLDAQNANRDPFMVPTKIKSNLEGAMGVFTYYRVDSLRVR